MKTFDPQAYQRAFIQRTEAEYRDAFPVSERSFNHGKPFFPNGTSQFGRFTDPFPVFAADARGAYIQTVDGPRLLDLWCGHFCMVLGHPLESRELTAQASTFARSPLQLGVPTEVESKVAHLITSATGYDQVVFSTSGALASMHSLQIAMATTKRSKVIRIDGGWHGVQPWGLAGSGSPSGSPGIPEEINESVYTIPFNDVEAAKEVFERHGETAAACVAELVLGNCGMVMATREFVTSLREQCDRFGVLLVLDELVTGFRVRYGAMQELFGVRADIALFGKAISGGMPFACIAADANVFAGAVSRQLGSRFPADAGTFTSHPATLHSVHQTLKHLRLVGDTWYTSVVDNAAWLQSCIRALFEFHGIDAEVTGASALSSLAAFPIATVRFGSRASPDRGCRVAHWDQETTNIQFRVHTARQALALRGVFAWQGLGVVSGALSPAHVETVVDAYRDLVPDLASMFPAN